MDWLTDEEIIRHTLNNPKATVLETALANRLADALDDVAALKDSNNYWNPHARPAKPGSRFVGDA